MPPKKYSEKYEYEERSLQDDFLDQLPRSREGRGVLPIWNGLNGEVRPGLKDKYGEVVDSMLPKPGLEIFRWWYGQANAEPPTCNVWKHDLGKLVCPTVFRDMDFFEELVEAYDLVTH